MTIVDLLCVTVWLNLNIEAYGGIENLRPESVKLLEIFKLGLPQK